MRINQREKKMNCWWIVVDFLRNLRIWKGLRPWSRKVTAQTIENYNNREKCKIDSWLPNRIHCEVAHRTPTTSSPTHTTNFNGVFSKDGNRNVRRDQESTTPLNSCTDTSSFLALNNMHGAFMKSQLIRCTTLQMKKDNIILNGKFTKKSASREMFLLYYSYQYLPW